MEGEGKGLKRKESLILLATRLEISGTNLYPCTSRLRVHVGFLGLSKYPSRYQTLGFHNKNVIPLENKHPSLKSCFLPRHLILIHLTKSQNQPPITISTTVGHQVELRKNVIKTVAVWPSAHDGGDFSVHTCKQFPTEYL